MPDAWAERETCVYKVADGCAIKADVLGADAGCSKPCVVWIHGGGLIFGSRKKSPRVPFLRALLERGFVVVSIDHRLAPETKLADIFDDVRDAWRWVGEQGPRRFGVDRGRMSMAGGSSGGYLSLIGGDALEPRPRALASFSGFGDITESWERDPSEFYRRMPLVTREQADQYVGAVPVSEESHGDRDYFYLYCRQHGRWLVEVTGHDPDEDPRWFDRWCPIRNLAADYPPTILVHGTEDTDVPHRQSEDLAARLTGVGAKHEFRSLAGVGNVFAGALPGQAEQVEAAVASFLQAQLARAA